MKELSQKAKDKSEEALKAIIKAESYELIIKALKQKEQADMQQMQIHIEKVSNLEHLIREKDERYKKIIDL